MIRRHTLTLYDQEVKTFHDSLSQRQMTLLDLLGVSTANYTE